MALLLIAYVAFQLLTLDYGTRVNDVANIAGYSVRSDVASGSALQRDAVITGRQSDRESVDLWMFRFKLYSVESDEVVNIIALARLRPWQFEFDPGFYQYGGAYLYPLGMWFFTLDKLGIIRIGTLDQLLADPQRMDRIWIFGRLFILLGVTLSALPLYAALLEITERWAALFLVAVYLFCPATVLFSQVLKPHWFALLWVNTALLVLVRGFKHNQLGLGTEIALGVTLGLTVASGLTFAPFTALVWFAIVGAAHRGIAARLSIVRVPGIALAIFALANPYYFVNWQAVAAERLVAQDWFRPSLHPRFLLQFIDNSMLTGLGIALTVAIGVTALRHLISLRRPLLCGLALAIVLPVWFMATVTASMAAWHINLRYVSYILPVGLLLLAVAWRRPRPPVLIGLAAATCLQMLPLKLAYFDENHPEHSTRLAAAAWIDANVAAGETVCLNTITPAPYEVPPFSIARYHVNAPMCRWRVVAEQMPDSAVSPAGYQLVRRFTPRLSPAAFPLVFGHINPQISIYRRE